MKKYFIGAIALVLTASFAFGSSVGIPLFVDNAPRFAGVPSSTPNKVTGLITLKSNVATPLTLSITYYNLEGDLLGPFGAAKTFSLAPFSSLAFRPVQEDPALGITGPTGVVGQNGGQEGSQGVLVPDRPISPDSSTPIPGTSPPLIDTKKNGSCVIEWAGGGDTDVQGQVSYLQTSLDGGGNTVTFSYSHLLPPGIS